MSGNKFSGLRPKHGETIARIISPEYVAYMTAKQRCNDPNKDGYKYYGGKGIEFRFDCFEDFLKEVGRKPSRKHTLGRINTEKHYESDNVRWETWTEQSRNRPIVKMTIAKARRIRWLWDHTALTQRDLAKMFEVNQRLIWGIINNKYWKE